MHYAYHPCDDAVLSLHELAGKNYVEQKEKRLMVEEITEGTPPLPPPICHNQIVHLLHLVYWFCGVVPLPRCVLFFHANTVEYWNQILLKLIKLCFQ